MRRGEYIVNTSYKTTSGDGVWNPVGGLSSTLDGSLGSRICSGAEIPHVVVLRGILQVTNWHKVRA